MEITSNKQETTQGTELYALYGNCRLCPRECGVNRFAEGNRGTRGFCAESHELRVAHVGPHFGEEPPITGTRGSGTIFFTGCSLRCSFCQNHQISTGGLGTVMTLPELLAHVEAMIRESRVHNLNLVTPDHFFPHAFDLISLIREKGYELPIVFNLSGYQSKDMLVLARAYADIYLPDFKYSDTSLSAELSKCRDYPKVAIEAVSEMVGQKGFLDSFEKDAPVATRGVLVRHLVLPGETDNSIKALTALFLEFGPRLPLSLMSQYVPATPQKHGDLNRVLRPDEFDVVYHHALELGFERLFVQFPKRGEETEDGLSPFLPDFRRAEPFSGNQNP